MTPLARYSLWAPSAISRLRALRQDLRRQPPGSHRRCRDPALGEELLLLPRYGGRLKATVREDELQRLNYNRHMLAAPLEPNVITIPYLARPHFRPFHASTKRFRYIVSHRRAGKSVALIVHMIIQCINNKRPQPPPKYAYVAPSFAARRLLSFVVDALDDHVQDERD